MGLSEQIKKLRREVANVLLLNSVCALLAAPATFTVLLYFDASILISILAALGATLGVILLNTILLTRLITRPFELVGQAISRLSPDDTQTLPPKPEELKFAQETTTGLIQAFYNLEQRLAHSSAVAKIAAGSAVDQRGSVLDMLTFPVISLNAKGEVLYANQNALALSGKKAEEVLGKSVDMVVPLRQKDISIVLPWLLLCQQQKIKDDILWEDISFVNPQRREYSFDVYGHYNRADSHGQEATLVLIDRTTMREYENMKVDFVALAAHELRAPITVIRGYMEVFEEELGGQLPAEYREFLTKMKVSGAQLAAFINNILDASRADRGRLNLHFTRSAWEPVLRDSIDNLSLQAEALGRRIDLTIEPELAEVVVDPVSIVEVINNLVDNSIKYSPSGSVITVISKKGDNGGVQTDVTDHGIGIPANLMDKLFTKFYRSHRSRQQFSGTGLGLYLSKAIIEAHRGNIWANSKEGEGSTFSFWLPPADSVANELTSPDNKVEAISRGTHGWIKNHSLYRR